MRLRMKTRRGLPTVLLIAIVATAPGCGSSAVTNATAPTTAR